MNMISVSSSNIASIGYENGTLHVQFHSGGLYAYFDVPEYVYVELMAAASHGKYLRNHIKGRYQYARLR